MNSLAQLGIVATFAWDIFALCVFPLFLWRSISLPWPVLACLVFLSVIAGVLINCLRPRRKLPKTNSNSVLEELTMLRAVVANLPDMIYVKDADSHFLMANQGAAENNGAATGAELIGKTDFDFFPHNLAAEFLEDEQKVLISGKPQVSKEEHIPEAGGHARCILTTKVPLFDASGRPIGIVGIGRNISALKAVEAELKRARDELAFKADHDSLTSLLNRGAILEMLSRELARSARENGRTTVLLGDLDLFKNVNDEYGHPIGDQVLIEVANRPVKTVRPYDLVGRFGGEEFLIVLPGCTAPDALARACQIRQAIAASPIPTAHGPVDMTISIGVLVAQE
jgi:diguanylate cyclase (GGDEF)-like protein/PAS domain S-box-containing protein